MQGKFIKSIKSFLDLNNDRCYEEHKNNDGKCYGLVGGTKSTEYLSESCIGCDHLTPIKKG